MSPGLAIKRKYSQLRKHRGRLAAVPLVVGATYPASELFPHSSTSEVPFLSR